MNRYVLVLIVMILLLIGVINLITFTEKSENTLVLVAVVFKSADKTPAANATYPNDPHKNNAYYPYGRGQITTQSLKKIYDIGNRLKSKYANFIGEFRPSVLSATAGSAMVSQLSMQTILAGLFPPSEQQQFVEDLKWQPMFYHTIPYDDDDMLAIWGKCKDFQSNSKNNRRFFSTPQVKDFIKKYESTFQYITKHSGERVSKLFDANAFYSILQSQLKIGLALPAWAKHQVYPEPLRTIATEYWKTLAINDEAVKLTSGKLLKTIINEFQQKTHKNTSNREITEKKILFFSGYDYALNGLLASLQVQHDYQYDTGAFLVFELHQIGNEYFVKVFYQNHNNSVPIEQMIGDCKPFCSLTEIIKMTQKYFNERDDLSYC